ncbi:NifU family protein [Catalinimonas alkaloidigena]|nr:NifU family protein [Catalinimonas alkaloidigena]
MDSNMNIKAKVEIALNAIRPYLEADGGDVKVLDVTDEGLVTLELLGNCGSCPMSAMTLKAGVEDAIKRAVPEVSAVEAVNMTTPDDPWAKMPFE